MAIANSSPTIGRIATAECWLQQAGRTPGRWLCAFALLLALQINPWWFPAPDACSYLSIARSIAEGHPPTNLGSRHLWYSPGYAVLISPVFLSGQRPFLLLSILQWCFAVGALLGAYVWARRNFPDAAILIAGLAVMNGGFWFLFRRNLSEVAFTCGLVWAVNAIQAVLSATTLRKQWAWLLGASLLVTGLCLTRQAGFCLVAGFGLALCCEPAKRRMSFSQAAALFAGLAIPAAGALLAVMRYDAAWARLDEGTTYLGILDNPEISLVAQLIEGLRLRIADAGQLLLPGMLKSYSSAYVWLDVNMAIYVPLFVLLAIGWWRLVRRQGDLLAFSLPFYLLLYILWGQDSGTRFMAPILGLLVACLWMVARSTIKAPLCFLLLLLISHFGCALGYYVAVDLPRARELNAQWSSIQKVTDELGEGCPQVAAWQTSEDTHWMLALALDRRVELAADARQLPTNTAWIVAEHTANVPGFAQVNTVGDFHILVRSAAGPSVANREQR